MNEATIRSSFLHTGEREGAFLHILHKLDTMVLWLGYIKQLVTLRTFCTSKGNIPIRINIRENA